MAGGVQHRPARTRRGQRREDEPQRPDRSAGTPTGDAPLAARVEGSEWLKTAPEWQQAVATGSGRAPPKRAETRSGSDGGSNGELIPFGSRNSTGPSASIAHPSLTTGDDRSPLSASTGTPPGKSERSLKASRQPECADLQVNIGPEGESMSSDRYASEFLGERIHQKR